MLGCTAGAEGLLLGTKRSSDSTCLSFFSKKNGICQLESQTVWTVQPSEPAPLQAVVTIRWLLLVLDASKTHSRMLFVRYVHKRFLNTGLHYMANNRPFSLTNLS